MASEEPDYKQIRAEFLAHVRRFHEGVQYVTDWKALCSDFGIEVQAGVENKQFTFQDQSFITYDASEPANRQLFTGLHELSHYLFEQAEACFRALLEDKYPLDTARDLEERLCNEAAGILLVPDHILETTMTRHGYDPRAVFELADRAGSLAACLMRVLLTHNLEAWGVILGRDGSIEFCCTTSRFPLQKNYTIESEHCIHEAWSDPIEVLAPLPYASGYREIKCSMRAASNGRRVIALFAKSFPIRSDHLQPSVF